jgi:hypothetical protein
MKSSKKDSCSAKTTNEKTVTGHVLGLTYLSLSTGVRTCEIV